MAAEQRNARLLRVDGVDLCVETFGVEGDASILLISGAAASMDWWPEAFCERLAAAGRYVIRYDHRDTGRSVAYEPGAPGYTGQDLVDDVGRVLDALGVRRAHLVGISMGGALAQCVAVDVPERVASLTLISTSPALSRAPDSAALPRMSPALDATFSEPPREPDWTDRTAVIDYIVEGERPYRGSVHTGDVETREVAGRIFDRTTNIASSMTNHSVLEDGDRIRPPLREIRVPTLVIHGTEDPLFPFAHALALRDEIPGAELLPLEGVGHQMPPRETWHLVVPAIQRHTSR